MCGRYTLHADKKKLAAAFKIPEEKIPLLKPRYNIAPSNPVAVIFHDREKRLEIMTWGLVPSWAKEPAIGNKMINARAETLIEKPSFRGPFKNSRCLVLADGFFEWKQQGGVKQPYYICLASGEPFAFAGLWAHWDGANGSEIYSCTIITREAVGNFAMIHHRMPVILSQVNHDRWLDPGLYDPKVLNALLAERPNLELNAYPVSTLVNSPRNDVPACLERVDE